MTKASWLVPVAILAIACGAPKSKTDGGVDGGDAGGPMSACGHPGDMGNSFGVGQYCDDNTPCSNGGAICSTAEMLALPPDSGVPATYFCTIPQCDPCKTPQQIATICGPDAFCACFGGIGCGCAPNACASLEPADAGMSCGDAG